MLVRAALRKGCLLLLLCVAQPGVVTESISPNERPRPKSARPAACKSEHWERREIKSCSRLFLHYAKLGDDVNALTMVVILYLFCYVLIKTAKADTEQTIILVPGEPIIVEQTDPDDELSNTYIYQEGEKPIVCTPAGNDAVYCI